MKVALCISGQPRSLKLGFESAKKMILDRYDPDVFIHFWHDPLLDGSKIKTGELFGRSLGWNPWKQAENTESLTLNLYQPKKFLFEPQIDFSELYDLAPSAERPFIRNNHVSPFNILSQHYSIQRSNQLRLEYTTQEKKEYDWVIRMRTDLNFVTNFDLKNFSPDQLYVPAITKMGPIKHYSDCFAFSNSNNMNVYMSLYEALPILGRVLGLKGMSETMLYYHLKSKGILARPIFENSHQMHHIELIR